MENKDERIKYLENELANAVNELCYCCGNYKTEYQGSCDGCRFKKIREEM